MIEICLFFITDKFLSLSSFFRILDPLTLPPGFIRLCKRAATTTKPLDGLDCAVMSVLLVQANTTPLYALVLVDTRHPCALVLVHTHATPVLLTIRQSGSHLSIHSCTSACLSISYWFTHKPTIFTIPERSIHTHRWFRLLPHL